MGIPRSLFNVCTAFLLLSSPAIAQNALTPVNFSGQYIFSFARMEFGRLELDVKQKGEISQIMCDINTTGLVDLFVQHSSHSTLLNTGKDGTYESNYKTRKKARYVKILSRDSYVKSEEIRPLDPPGKRSPVPPEMKKAAHSPLDFLLAMRSNLYNALKNNEKTYSLLFYDGRRLTQAHFSIEARKTIKIGDTKYQTIRVAARRTLIGGFTKDELEEYDANEPTVYLYYSDDDRLIPLRIEFKMGIATVAATLRKECASGESCLTENKQ